jgi:hypothetical protein
MLEQNQNISQQSSGGGLSLDFLGQLSTSVADIFKVTNKNYNQTQLGIAEANARSSEALNPKPKNNMIWVVVVAVLVILLVVLLMRK